MAGKEGEGFFGGGADQAAVAELNKAIINIADGELVISTDESGRVVLSVGDNGLVIPFEKLLFIARTFSYIAGTLEATK
jgi:hypothetical protein